MAKIRSVAVFCGAQPGNRPAFRAGAEALGRGLAEAGSGWYMAVAASD